MNSSNLIRWWNDNAFCGYVISSIFDITKCLEELRFKTVTEMIVYHEKQDGNAGFYLREIINRNLVDSSSIDRFLSMIGVTI